MLHLMKQEQWSLCEAEARHPHAMGSSSRDPAALQGPQVLVAGDT